MQATNFDTIILSIEDPSCTIEEIAALIEGHVCANILVAQCQRAIVHAVIPYIRAEMGVRDSIDTLIDLTAEHDASNTGPDLAFMALTLVQAMLGHAANRLNYMNDLRTAAIEMRPWYMKLLVGLFETKHARANEAAARSAYARMKAAHLAMVCILDTHRKGFGSVCRSFIFSSGWFRMSQLENQRSETENYHLAADELRGILRAAVSEVAP